MAKLLGVFPDEPPVLDVIVVKNAKEAAMLGYKSALPRRPKAKRAASIMDAVQWRNNF